MTPCHKPVPLLLQLGHRGSGLAFLRHLHRLFSRDGALTNDHTTLPKQPDQGGGGDVVVGGDGGYAVALFVAADDRIELLRAQTRREAMRLELPVRGGSGDARLFAGIYGQLCSPDWSPETPPEVTRLAGIGR